MGRAGWRRRKTALLIAVAVLAGGIGVVAYATHLLRRTELQTIDARFSIRGTQRAPARTSCSCRSTTPRCRNSQRRHLHSEFPFPRAYDARVIDHLREAGAQVIAVDIQFTQPTDPTDDTGARRSDRTGARQSRAGHHRSRRRRRHRGARRQLSCSANWARGRRARGLTVDTDGAVRRFPLRIQRPAELPGRRRSGNRQPATACTRSLFEADGTLPIDFAGPPGTVHAYSFSKVLTGEYPTERCSPARSSSSARQRRSCRTSTPPPRPTAARCRGRKSGRNAVSTLSSGACRCATRPAGSTCC